MHYLGQYDSMEHQFNNDSDMYSQSGERDSSRPWWERLPDSVPENEIKNKEMASVLYERAKNLLDSQNELICKMMASEAFYNLDSFGEIGNLKGFKRKASSYNVIRSCSNTVKSKIGADQPKVTFLTDGARYSLRSDAKKLDELISAEFKKSRLYRVMRKVVLDSVVSKLGIVKITSMTKDKEIKFKAHRVRPLNFFVDDGDESYEMKAETFERMKISKHYLIKKLKLDGWKKKRVEQCDPTKNKVTCWEAYYKDKFKVYFIKDCILHIEGLDGWPPYFYLRWTEKTDSFWGNGISDELDTIQERINKTLLDIAHSSDTFGRPRIIMDFASRVANTQITNELGGVIKVTGAAGAGGLDFLTPPVMHPQYFQHLEDLYQKAFQETGISQLVSSAEKPKGFDSAKAIIAQHDIQLDRFASYSSDYQDMFIDIARFMAIRMDNHYTGKKVTKSDSTEPWAMIRWDAIDLKKNYRQIDLYPENLLSKAPASRYQEVKEMVQDQMIGREEAMMLLEFPDVKRVRSLRIAGVEATHKLLDDLLEGGDIMVDQQIAVAVQLEAAIQYYARALADGADEETLEKIRGFIDVAVHLRNAEVMEQQQQQQEQVLQAQMAQQTQEGPAPGDGQQPPQGPLPRGT